MAGFLYFLPNVRKTPSKADLPQAAYAYAFERPYDLRARPLDAGPNGLPGMLLGERSKIDESAFAFNAAQQKWIHHRQADFLVGMWLDRPAPTPDELQRSTIQSGYRYAFTGLHEWIVPIARTWADNEKPKEWLDSTCLLESCLEFNGQDFQPTGVVPRLAELWAIAEASFRLLTNNATATDKEALFGTREALTAIRALQVNYRLGPCEASLLGLVTDRFARIVFELINDLPLYDELQKKRASLPSAGIPSYDGPGDSSPVTNPQDLIISVSPTATPNP